MGLEDALEYVRARRSEHLEVLFEYLAQPSVSAQELGVMECASLLVEMLTRHGITARTIETAGAPVVYGEVASADPDAPTVLVYGHYDVQPPEPLELWSSAPFEPEVRDGRIYGRGSADNKGQNIAHVFAVQALQASGGLPVNVKLVLEGQEENGSPYLDSFVASHRDLLAADLVYTSDGSLHRSGRPVVCFGVRGTLGVELSLRTANRDVHSGNFGNLVPDPTWELLQVLRSIRDGAGRVLVEGFYEDVREPSAEEVAMGAAVPFDPASLVDDLGLRAPVVRSPDEHARALMFEPTCTITGFASGYTGKGMKTIVPGEATVKIDFRLVADQSPEDIYEKVITHVAAVAPAVEVRHLGAMRPSRTPVDTPLGGSVVDAVRRSQGHEPIVVPVLGGSLPDATWTQTLGVPSVLVPYANHDSANHAPNENLEVDAFYAGIETSVHVLEALGAARERSGT